MKEKKNLNCFFSYVQLSVFGYSMLKEREKKHLFFKYAGQMLDQTH